MLKTLFGSQVRVALLRLFLLNPETPFYARGLTQQLDFHYNAVWKELQNLERADILASETEAHIKHYRLNPRCAIVPELRSIFLKTTALGDALRPIFTASPDLCAAFIYGSAASNELDAQSDIDLMLIGNINLVAFAPQIRKQEMALGRSINYTFFTQDEWQAKRRVRDPFIENVVAFPKIFLVGSEDALRQTRSTKTHPALSSKVRRNTAAAQTRDA